MIIHRGQTSDPTQNPTYASVVNCQQSESCECSPGPECIFNCEGDSQCADTKLATSYDGQNITINCIGSSACEGLRGDLSSASSVTWNCQGSDACRDANLAHCAPTCNLNCLCDGICGNEQSCGDDYRTLINGTFDSCNGLLCITSAPSSQKKYFRITLDFDFAEVQSYVDQIGSTMELWALDIITYLLNSLVNENLISITIIDVLDGSIIIDFLIESDSSIAIAQALQILNTTESIDDLNGNFTLPVSALKSYTPDTTDEPTKNPTMSDFQARVALYTPELDELTDLYRVIAGSFAGIIVLIGLAAIIDAKKIRINDYFRIGALVTFFTQTMDMISDCFFAAQLYIHSKIELDDGYTAVFGLSIVFIVLPAMTALFQLYFYARKHWLENDHTRVWLRKFSTILLLLSIMTGSSFAAANLLNSYIFQLDILDMGLTQKQLKGFNTKRVYSIVILEVHYVPLSLLFLFLCCVSWINHILRNCNCYKQNLPQLCIQVYFVSQEGANGITISSMIFSLVSIIVSILSMYMEKRIDFTSSHVVITMNVTGNSVKKQAKKCKTKCKKLKDELAILIGAESSTIEIIKPRYIKGG